MPVKTQQWTRSRRSHEGPTLIDALLPTFKTSAHCMEPPGQGMIVNTQERNHCLPYAVEII